MNRLLHNRVINILQKYSRRIDNSKKRINAEKVIEESHNTLYNYLNKKGFKDREIYDYLSKRTELWILMHRICGEYNHKIELKNLSEEEQNMRIDDICYLCDEKFDQQNKNYNILNYEYVLKYPIKVQARSKSEAFDKLDNDYLTGDFNNNRLQGDDMKIARISDPNNTERREYLENEKDLENYIEEHEHD